jgi:magnesium chelatase accessory protein
VYFYRRLIPALIASGRRTIAIDLRGHGASDKPRDAACYSAPAMAEFAERVLSALDLPPLHIVAHSMGGGVTLDLAVRAPERLLSVTLLAPVGLAQMRLVVPFARLATPPLAAPLVPYAVPRWSIPLMLRGLYGDNGTFASRDVDEYWAPTADPNFALALRSLLHRFDFAPRSDAQLARIAVPKLVILGGRDLLVRSRTARVRAERLPGTTVRYIERAGHVLAEEVPDAVLGALLPHLDRSS